MFAALIRLAMLLCLVALAAALCSLVKLAVECGDFTMAVIPSAGLALMMWGITTGAIRELID